METTITRKGKMIKENKIKVIVKEDEEGPCDLCEEHTYPLLSWCTKNDMAYVCIPCITELNRSIPDGLRMDIAIQKSFEKFEEI